MSGVTLGPWHAVPGEGEEDEWGIVDGDGFVIALLGFKGPDAERVAKLIARSPFAEAEQQELAAVLYDEIVVRESAEADAERLAVALDVLQLAWEGRATHGPCGYGECSVCDRAWDMTVEALRLHKEQDAGD